MLKKEKLIPSSIKELATALSLTEDEVVEKLSNTYVKNKVDEITHKAKFVETSYRHNVSSKDCLVLRKFLLDTVSAIDNMESEQYATDDVKRECSVLSVALNDILDSVVLVNQSTSSNNEEASNLRLFNLKNLQEMAKNADNTVVNELLKSITEFDHYTDGIREKMDYNPYKSGDIQKSVFEPRGEDYTFYRSGDKTISNKSDFFRRVVNLTSEEMIAKLDAAQRDFDKAFIVVNSDFERNKLVSRFLNHGSIYHDVSMRAASFDAVEKHKFYDVLVRLDEYHKHVTDCLNHKFEFDDLKDGLQDALNYIHKEPYSSEVLSNENVEYFKLKEENYIQDEGLQNPLNGVLSDEGTDVDVNSKDYLDARKVFEEAANDARANNDNVSELENAVTEDDLASAAKLYKKDLVKKTNKKLSGLLSNFGLNSVAKVVNDVCEAVEKDLDNK